MKKKRQYPKHVLPANCFGNRSWRVNGQGQVETLPSALFSRFLRDVPEYEITELGQEELVRIRTAE